MAISSQKKLLAFGRAIYLATKEASSFVRQDGGWMYHDYAVADNCCTCPEYGRNAFMHAAAQQGKRVADYPGLVCKHQLAVRVLEGLDWQEVLAQLTEEQKELVRAGFRDQAQQHKEKEQAAVVEPASAERHDGTVAAMLVKADAKHCLITPDGRTVSRQIFGIDTMAPALAFDAARRRYGAGFTCSIIRVEAEWAKTLAHVGYDVTTGGY